MTDLQIIGAVILGVVIAYTAFLTYVLREEKKRYAILLQEKQDILESKTRSSAAQRATIKGQLAEQFFPLMPINTHEPSDMRFIGDFCDFLCVDGYTKCKDTGDDYIDSIVFVEIKTGKAQLSRHQKLIRDAVEAGRVRWETIRV